MSVREKFMVIMAMTTMVLTLNVSSRADDAKPNNDKNKVPVVVGALDIKWGDSLDTVRKVMLQKNYIEQTSSQDSNAVLFNAKPGVLFAGESVDDVLVLLSKKAGAAKVVVFLTTPTPEEDIFHQYERVTGLYIAKYSAPCETFKFFDTPYEDGDGYETTAIKVGKGHYSTFWNIRVSDADTDVNPSICVKITDNLEVAIAYENSKLMDFVQQENNAKKSKDI